MIKIIRQQCGPMTAIGIEGNSKEEIESIFNSFYNHGATDVPQINWQTETFGYFLTDEVRLKSALVNSSLMKICNDDDARPGKHRTKGNKGGAMACARKLAKERLEAIKTETFLRPSEILSTYFSILEQHVVEEEKGVVIDYIIPVEVED